MQLFKRFLPTVSIGIVSILLVVFAIIGLHTTSSPANNNKKDGVTSKILNNNRDDTDNNKARFSSLSERYTYTEFIRTPWGDGDGKVGIYDTSSSADAGPSIGPNSFSVDENGNIYVLDTVNGRVLRFDPNGVYGNSITIAPIWPDDIGVRNGNIYIFDIGSKKILKYDLTGKDIAVYTLPKALIYYGIYFDPR